MVDATQTQIRRGTQVECDAGVPAEGELWCDLTNDTLRVGDGSKAGGHLMPNVARMQSGQYMFATAGGTADAITVDLSPAVGALVTGMEFRFLATATNTGAATLNLNGTGAVGLRKIQSGSAIPLSSNDVSSGVIYNVVYDGTYFVLLSGVGSGIVAPVAGSSYDIYRVTPSSPVAQTGVNSNPALTMQYLANRLWNVRCNLGGSVRVSFQMRHQAPSTAVLATMTVFKNNSQVGVRSTNSNSFVTFSLDVGISQGDVLSFAFRAPESLGAPGQMRNLVISSSTPAYGAISG